MKLWARCGAIFCIATFCGGPAKMMAATTTPPSHAVIEKELSDAEKSFREAKSMFNPWYTGPILAPSAHLLPPGGVNIQPYLFFVDNYGKYSSSGKVETIPNFFQFNPQMPILVGILKWMELVVNPQALYNHQSGQSSFNIGDFSTQLVFGLLTETPYRPALVVAVNETFPTGKYQHLNPEKLGMDATGGGSYQTQFSATLGKVIWWWWKAHPMAVRLSLSYNVPSIVHVEGFNNYGGGYQADGHVHPGNTFKVDFGYEFSFTQRWAGALDIVYQYQNETTFSGYPGVTASGELSTMASPYNEVLSLAPAIEYNWNENLGLIAGVWFSVWGKNTFSFATGVVSVTYTF